MSPLPAEPERRLAVTYLAPFVPFDGIPHAGGRFLHAYLSLMAETVDVTLIAPSTATNREVLGQERPLPAVAIHLVPTRPRPRTRLGFLPRLVANSVAGVTPGWQVLHAFRQNSWVWDQVAASDVVELQWAWYLPFVRDIREAAPGVRITAFEHDVLAISLSRRAQYGFLHERTFGRFAASRARTAEPALLNLCDAVFTFSGHDADVLKGMGVRRPVEVIDPPVVLPKPVERTQDEPIVLFVGAMDRPENHQGAAWLAERVWPVVERSVGQAQLVLAGVSPPASLLRLAGRSVSVTGFVEDLDPLYRRARVFVAPNLTGAGVKFKVLDAMGYGLPVVATPVAAEGIADPPGGGGFASITDDADEMASAIVDLLQDPGRAAEIGEAGRSWVQRRYDFRESVKKVLATYRRIVASPPAAPQDAAEGPSRDPQVE